LSLTSSAAILPWRDLVTEPLKPLNMPLHVKNASTPCNCFHLLFLGTVSSPNDLSPFFIQGTYEELETLLNYTWESTKLEHLCKRGTRIEVYLGENDAIIHALTCKDFFVPFATVYYFKHVGHCLC